ncbi:MAG: hypothetical protein ABIM73_08645, partial [Arenimonas sp.]
MRTIAIFILLILACSSAIVLAESSVSTSVKSVEDAALAKQLGADENGMRQYVLVILKTGKHRVPDGNARDEMFKGHFANIKRLADEGKLAV